MRQLVTSYLDEFLARGDAIAFAHRRGLRTVRWSYRRIATSAFGFAELLAERGIQKSDRVFLCGNNSPEWVVAFFGCLLRGAIVVPLDVQNESGFVERVQQQVNAKLAILDFDASESFRFTLPVISLDQLGELTCSANSDSSTTLAPNDIAEIVFTSGTTAEPKGVVLTYQNLLANLLPLESELRPYLKWERLVHPIRFLNLLPLSHVFGQFMAIFVPQLLGSEVFFLDSLKPSQIVETVKRERISVIVCVPRMLETLRERVESEYRRGAHLNGTREPNHALQNALDAARNWSVPRRWWEFRRVHRMFGWKFWAFISGGATLDAATEKFWQRLGFAIIQGYGMTETASLVSVNHPFKKRSGSIGRVMHGQEISLSDEGEILVRGANVSTGYWTNADSARGSATNHEDRWFHTGDVGELDATGNLYFKGRKKEVIVTAAGMNVYPEDIEAVLNQQPQIKSAAVVGVEGPHGPEPVAALILRRDESSSLRFQNDSSRDPRIVQAIEEANQSLAEHQRVRRWLIWPEEDFPRTPTQKVKRQLIAQRISGLDQAAPAASSNALLDLIGRVSGGPTNALKPDAKLGFDVNLDSLGRLELLNAIEDRYQLELNETAFTEATTVGEIERLIRKQAPDDGVVQTRKSRRSDYPYPQWPHRWPVNWLRVAALYLIVFPFVRVMGRPRVRGAETLKDWKGSLLFVSNHLSMVDHALILWALPGRFRRRLSIAMDGELLREWLNPPVDASWLTRLRHRGQYVLVAFFFNVFAMPQETGVRRSFEFAGEMMDRGFSVLVFPEGRRSPDGEMKPFRHGTGLLAKQLNAPVVPIRLEGIHELRQLGKHFASPGAITVNIGSPVKFATDNTPEEISAQLEARVRNA
jgi:long-chain acyl-CoA synthetase